MSDSQSRLSPDQIRFLMSPIFGPALRQDPKAAKGNVYIPGNFVLAQLNTAFCFDGWSFQVNRVERVHMEKYQKDGKDQFKALYLVEGTLTIRCQDGSTFQRSGIGTDEKTSSNMKDVVSLATKAAVTDAIKNAAITLGRQFGLDTVRAGKDESGTAINWRKNTSGERPRPPMFAGLSTAIEHELDDEEGETVTEDGLTYNTRTGEVVQDNRPQHDQGRPQEQQRRPEQQEQRREPAPSQTSGGQSQERTPQQQQRSEPAQQGGNGGSSQTASGGSQGGGQGGNGQSNGNAGQGGGEDRTALVNQCREAFRAAGAGAAGNVFSQVAQRHGYQGSMPMIGRPENNGGPSGAFLRDYLDALRKVGA